jgi:hypothetical protein
MSRTCSHGLFAVAFSLAALAAIPRTSTADERPFKASLTGNAHLSPTDDPFVLRNDETGKGTATHLGAFTWNDVEYADFASIPGGVAVVGTFTMTAADGDRLYGEFTSIGAFDQDGNLAIRGHYLFTGGTGRFAEATGSGDIDAIANLSPGLPFEGTFTGTLGY